MALSACSRLKRVQCANHTVKMDDSRMKKKNSICLWGRSHVGIPRSRLEDAVWRDGDLLQIQIRRAATRKREFLRKEIGEAMAGKRAAAPWKVKKP